MSTLDKKYFIKLDTKNSTYNNILEFAISDNDTSDMIIRVTNKNKLINLSNVIILMVAISPNSTPYADFLEVESAEEGLVYCNLKNQFKNIEGTWSARLMLIYEDDKVITSTFSYNVSTDEFVQLNEQTIVDDRFPVLTDLISRLSQIEMQENNRQEAELNRVEAEIQREITKQQLIAQVNKLISDTNLKVENNLSEQNTKVNQLISNTNTKIDNYKTEKDLAIDQDLKTYKNNKDLEINQKLESYKTATTADIESYKNSKNAEINQYKTEKDLQIDNKLKEVDNAEIDRAKEFATYENTINTLKNDFNEAAANVTNGNESATNSEIVLARKGEKSLRTKIDKIDEQFNTKASKEEVEIERQRITNLATLEQGSTTGDAELIDGRVGADAVIYKNLGTAIRTQIKNVNSRIDSTETINTTQNNRLTNIETKNKIQDIYLGGLFNENNDKRLTVEGLGNTLALTGSKKGLATVDKIVGDTMVNLYSKKGSWVIGTTGLLAYNSNNVLTNIPLKENTVYTSIILNGNGLSTHFYDGITNTSINGSFGTFTTKTKTSWSNSYLHIYVKDSAILTQEFLNNLQVILLEGDYTSKPIPQQYFDGLKSSFEGQLVTQEMVTAGTEKAENLGKYKCKVKVRGKNLFDGKLEVGDIKYTNGNLENNSSVYRSVNYIKVNPGSNIYFSHKGSTTSISLRCYDGNKNYIMVAFSNGGKIPNNVYYVKFVITNKDTDSIQLEEGTVATSYEPCYERTQAVYLTSPLLKGDEIVVKEDGLYHYHKMGKVVLNGSESWAIYGTSTSNSIAFKISKSEILKGSILMCDKLPYKYEAWDDKDNYEGVMKTRGDSDLVIRILKTRLSTQDVTGFKQWLQANPTTVVYELAEPYYEKISDYKIALECPTNATLSVESVIPCTSIKSTYTGSIPSVYALENSVENIESQNVDIVATTWDVDYRLCEVEWVLEDAGITGINLASTFNLNMRGVNKMALTRYEQAKIMILGGAYEKETLTRQLTRYLEKGLVTQEEYDELIALMEARELVTGE